MVDKLAEHYETTRLILRRLVAISVAKMAGEKQVKRKDKEKERQPTEKAEVGTRRDP